MRTLDWVDSFTNRGVKFWYRNYDKIFRNMRQISSTSNVYITATGMGMGCTKTVSRERPPSKCIMLAQALDPTLGTTTGWQRCGLQWRPGNHRHTSSQPAGQEGRGQAVGRMGSASYWYIGRPKHPYQSRLLGRSHRLKGLSALSGDTRSGDADHSNDGCENGPPYMHEG